MAGRFFWREDIDMEKCICFCLLLVGGSLLARQPGYNAINDHLIPVAGRLKPHHEQLLARKLFVTPADYMRVVELPAAASEGESVIAIYSKIDSPTSVMITLMRPERNLVYAEFAGDPDFPKGPKVSRFDVPFAKSSAVAIRTRLKRLLAQARPLRKSNNPIFLDGTDIEFSVPLGNQSIRGLLIQSAAGKKRHGVATPCRIT